jgi:glycosyltransferase involved in cell wall biosynthesis
METLEPLLSSFCITVTASDKRNQALRMFDLLYHFFRYSRWCDKIIIDVYSTLAFQYAFILGLLSRIIGKPYILVLHGGNLPKRFQKKTWQIRLLFSGALKLIAPSPYLARFFEQQGFKVIIIPNIIELEVYPHNERVKIRPRILALRGFGKPYNPLMTLSAINILKDKIPGIKLLLLGNSDEHYYNEVIEYIDKHQLASVVEVQSKMPKKDWIALSKNYDIMVSNPVIDNTPISLLEGMALGMCVISTKVGGVTDLVNTNLCSLIASGDVEALCQSIQKILSEPEYAHQLSLAGRKEAEKYDWNNIKPLWHDLICN